MIEEPNFDLYITLGMVIKGKASDLQQLLDDIKTYPVTVIFTKTSAGKLEITEIG
jgi:hypothetical protein